MPEQQDVLQTTVTATVGDDSFVFRIPGIRDEVAISALMKRMRIQAGDTFGGDLDYQGMQMLRACAVFETQLAQSTARWVFSPGPQGGPRVDSARWPIDKVDTVLSAYDQYDTEVARFRTGGGGGRAAGQEAVAGEPDPGLQPVLPGPPGA